MVIIILATVLILAIAYFQVVQGLFSAAIMTILSIVCAALALNTYEALGEAFLYSRQGPYADAVALIVLFVLPLLAVRIVLDKFVSANVVFGSWADRIGGGLLGIVTGMVLVGMLLIVMQMLPFGETVLGYRPYDDALRRDQRAWPLYPDEFTVGLARLVSRGALSAEASFDTLHDDLLLEAFCARNTAGKNGGVHAAPDAARVHRAYEPPPEKADWLAKVPEGPGREAGAITKVVVLQVSVGDSAADADQWFRLPGTHFRLVANRPQTTEQSSRDDAPDDDELVDDEGGDEPDDEPDDDAPPGGRSYYPLGMLELNGEGTQWKFVPPPVKDDQTQIARLVAERKLPKSKATSIQWVYRIAEKEVPEYLVFRRVSRCRVPRLRRAAPEVPRPTTKAAPPEKKAPSKKPRPKGRPAKKAR